ncbi:hypothetical protein [Pontibacter arcticus]|uniref:SpoIIAA-like n=1 Tax=Pontibacter arcticus TaxID=2080288 RepID=A0A364RJ78_9BACT|nr:hypothetical protein [Pontibacter arcticus]RAU84341.1 hypothetical protein DP923_04700 [Pontibacter arcticus]
MILFESYAVRLDYDPATDILTADLSQVNEFYKLEIQEAFQAIATTVSHYDVKRLLMDSRKRIVAVDNETYSFLLNDFLQKLKETRLQRMARLHSGIAARETLADRMQEQVATHFEMVTFTDKDKALAWLVA